MSNHESPDPSQVITFDTTLETSPQAENDEPDQLGTSHKSWQHNLGRSVHTLEVCVYHLLPLKELEEIEPPFSEDEEMMKKVASVNGGIKSADTRTSSPH
ncbi:hypothetical protein EDB81DRAFT_830005, partial [Dactylonectria macrodidyma]